MEDVIVLLIVEDNQSVTALDLIDNPLQQLPELSKKRSAMQTMSTVYPHPIVTSGIMYWNISCIVLIDLIIGQ